MIEKGRMYGRIELLDGGTHIGWFDGDNSVDVDGRIYARDSYRLLSPVSPSKLICAGFNYRAHAGEMSQPLPEEPLLFLKPPSAVVAHGEQIVRPRGARIEYEGELVVVIGRRAKDVSPQSALDFVGGLTIGNDITAREFQLPGTQWIKAKCQDTFAPIGPCVLESTDWAHRHIETKVNGRVVQSASTSQLIFDVPTLVAHASALMTLEPGDVVFTGTPAGVGPLQDADVVEVSIEGIGILVNTVAMSMPESLGDGS